MDSYIFVYTNGIPQRINRTLGQLYMAIIALPEINTRLRELYCLCFAAPWSRFLHNMPGV